MTKKKFIKFISTTMIIFTLISSFGFAAPKDDIVSNYLYKDIDRILSNINLVSKTMFTSDDYKSPEKEAKIIKAIDGYISEITYILSQIQNQISEYNDDKSIQNKLYGINLVLSELKYALINLRESITTNDKEQEYYFQESFFILKAEATRKIDIIKKLIPK